MLQGVHGREVGSALDRPVCVCGAWAVVGVCARCAPCIVSCHMWDSIRLAVDTAVVNDDDHVPSSTVDLALGLGLGSL